MMRICMLHQYYLPLYSGAAIRSHNQARIILEWNHRVWVLTPRYPGLLNEECLDGIRVVRADIYGQSRKLQFLSFMFSASKALVRYREEYDLLHLFSFGPFHLLPVLVAKALGKRVLYQVTMMGDNRTHLIGSNRVSSLVRVGLRLVDGFTVLSTPLLQAFEAEGLLNRPIRVIPNGVNTTLYHPPQPEEKAAIRGRLGLKQGVKYICFVGSVEKRKGVDVLIAAFEEVAEQSPDANLLVVGPDVFLKPGFEDRPYQQAQAFVDTLKQHVNALGLASRITFIGQTNLVSDYLQASDLFAFPSHREGFPNVIIEAMACGLPCVVSYLDGISEDIIHDGVDGFIIRNHDPSLYAKRMLQVLNDRALSEQIGRAARHTVEREFRLEDVVSRYVSFCEEVLQN